MRFSAAQAAQITSAALAGEDANFFTKIITDSRNAAFAQNSLFVAIKGERHDGHLYIKQLYEAGCRIFLISEDQQIDQFKGASFILVKDTRAAFQRLAAYKRSLFHIPVISITGSNGKTIVKEWLWQLLNPDFTICKNPKSYNSQIGVPLSVWQLDEQDNLAVFEAGISQKNEMQKLEEIIKPSIGIFTNVGSAHDENFASREEKTAEKFSLFKSSKTIIYCKDYKEIDALCGGKETFSWSWKDKADLQVLKAEEKDTYTILTVLYKEAPSLFKIPFTDKASLENCLHCIACMLYLNYKPVVINHRLSSLAPLGMRMEMKQGVNNCTLVDDAYSNDIHSLRIALDLLNGQKQHPCKIVILSDILQSGKDTQALYTEVSELLAEKKVDRLIGIGEKISSAKNIFQIPAGFYPSTSAFISAYKRREIELKDAAILLKGARSFEFERLQELLQQKTHDTVLEINLNNLVHNLNYYRGRLFPGTGIMPMVKAFSYGSGSFEIANALQHHHVNYFAVAYADEGVELRENGISTPIMVMNPERQSFAQLLQYNLEPEIFSFSLLEGFAHFLSAEFSRDANFSFPVHIKLDTGMHRLGFDEAEVEELIQKLRQYPFLKVRSIFSHLAASDDARLDDFTNQQIALFEKMSAQISSALSYPVFRHLCNSAAISRFPQAHYNMVRLGIGLYGIGANLQEQKQLMNVSSLKTVVSQVKHLTAGDTVGYSRKGKISAPSVIATVPIGYADGLNRRLSNGIGKLYMNGKAAPIVGNVCMDMCMIDVTGMNVKEGDEVIVFDSAETLNDLAEALGTIPYEVLTSVSARVKRVYLQE